jgi:hypothetical protein
MNKIFIASIGGIALGFGIIMIIASLCPSLKALFDVNLFGLGIAVISLGALLWDKIKLLK